MAYIVSENTLLVDGNMLEILPQTFTGKNVILFYFLDADTKFHWNLKKRQTFLSATTVKN